MRLFLRLVLITAFPLILLSEQACSSKDQSRSDDSTSAARSLSWLKVVSVESNDALSMRSSPSRQSPILLSIPYDEKNIIKLEEKGKWFRVSYRGLQGWAYSKYLAPAKAGMLKNTFGGELVCFGGEPHWSLSTLDQTLTYGLFDESAKFLLNTNVREGLNRSNIWYAQVVSDQITGENMTIVIEKTACSDDMSDVDFPYRINLIDDSRQLLSGCCRN